MIQSQELGVPLGECPNWVINRFIRSLSGSTQPYISWILRSSRDHTGLFRRKLYVEVLRLVAILKTYVAIPCPRRIYWLKNRKNKESLVSETNAIRAEVIVSSWWQEFIPLCCVAMGESSFPEHLGNRTHSEGSYYSGHL